MTHRWLMPSIGQDVDENRRQRRWSWVIWRIEVLSMSNEWLGNGKLIRQTMCIAQWTTVTRNQSLCKLQKQPKLPKHEQFSVTLARSRESHTLCGVHGLGSRHVHCVIFFGLNILRDMCIEFELRCVLLGPSSIFCNAYLRRTLPLK